MSTMFTYRDLEVWKRAMDLVEHCYRSTTHFPKAEMYALSGQLRRAAISIPSNIAEGHCRRTTKSYINHVSIALGSHGELETCIELADRLGFLSRDEKRNLDDMTGTVGRLLNGLHRALERKLN
jgi:four helix bundle protein